MLIHEQSRANDSCSLEPVRPADALFIMIGATANTNWLPATSQRDDKGFICTGHMLRLANVDSLRSQNVQGHRRQTIGVFKEQS
jgi:hypothetical protein